MVVLLIITIIRERGTKHTQSDHSNHAQAKLCVTCLAHLLRRTTLQSGTNVIAHGQVQQLGSRSSHEKSEKVWSTAV